MTITSKDNETIKHIKKLKEKKYREEYGEFIVEGIKMIEEALNEGAKVKSVIICEDCKTQGCIPNELMYEIAKLNCIYVAEKVFNTITDVINPQGIMAVIEKPQNQEKIINYSENVSLLLDNIQDPGNMGTILRTADSLNMKQIIVSKGTADSYNSKVVRSTMGAIFRVKIIECEDLEKTLKEVKKQKYELVITSLQTKNSIYDIKYNKKVIVIGNEGNGVSKRIQDMADVKVKIPMIGKTESLNVSVATGIVLYEYIRQKLL